MRGDDADDCAEDSSCDNDCGLPLNQLRMADGNIITRLTRFDSPNPLPPRKSRPLTIIDGTELDANITGMEPRRDPPDLVGEDIGLLHLGVCIVDPLSLTSSP